MNIKKNTIKTIIGTTTVCSALMLGGVGATNMLQPKYEVFATGVNSIPISISNANFDENKKSNYPYSPSSYSAYVNGLKVESSTNLESKVKAGVINLTNEDYETRFPAAKETSRDNYVLMIDSKDKDSESYYNVNYGFQMNSTTKLDANSKYMFTVDVFSASSSNDASLYLFDNNGEIFSSIKNIGSFNSWTTYTFFVATNNTDSLELKLGMYLEGAGTVLFDNISAFKMSDKEYDFTVNSLTAGTFKEENKADEANNVVKTYHVNSLGQLESNTSETSVLTQLDYEQGKNSTLDYDENSDGQNKYAFILKNTDKTYNQYETDEILTFEQNRVYKVSINVKTKDLNGKAILQLIRTDIDEDDDEYNAEKHNPTISITTNSVSSAESVTNDYKTYSFYINSHNSKDVSYKLKFGLGTEEDLTEGEMYLSEIEVSKINYETFSSAKTGSDAEKIDFVDAYSNSSIMLNNGDFNSFKIADYSNPMPATPTDWEVTIGKNTQKYGVVNTKTFTADLNGLNLSNLTNPSPAANNNVLMMYNESADTLSYKSASKNLTEKSYHKFEARVQTQNAPLTISLVSKKDDSEIVIASKTVNTNYSWEDVTFYVYTGYQSLDVSLKLTLNTESYGYAFIDNTKFDYETNLEDQFKSASNSSYTAVVDLSNLISSENNEKFATSNFFSNEKIDNVDCGIVTINESYLDEVIDEAYLSSFNSIASKGVKNAFVISTMYDNNFKATSNVGFKLTTGEKYYKISVDVFTQGISSNTTEANQDLIGAGIKLTGFDNAFESIKSNNEWTTYTFYVQPQSETTTYLEFSLGNEANLTKGTVCFANIQFSEDVTAEEYNTVKESNIVKIVKAETKAEENTTPEEETTTDDKINNSSWMFLIPGLLTAAAILIAVVGVMIRKIKWKNPFKKKSKTSYDRNKTVSVQYYSRKATTMREEKVRELKADLEKINTERKQYEEEYKLDLTRLREMKIKRANPAEISKLEKDMKKNQKLSSSLGVTANRISAELEYAQTDMYLNSLIKKLAREGSSSNKENETEQEK